MSTDPLAVARLCADYNTRIAALEEALASVAAEYRILDALLDDNDEALDAVFHDDVAGMQRERIERLAADRDDAIRRAERAERGWTEEANDADGILHFLGLDPLIYRTEGGRINVPKINDKLRDERDAAIAKEGER